MSLSLEATQPPSRAAGEIVRPAKRKTFPERVWEMAACFRSVHLAIVLLGLLALATLAGVLLPQEAVVDPLQIKRDFGPNYRMMKAMGLFNVYSSYWFVSLEVLFFFNLLLGSFQWLKPAFLAATQVLFCGPEHILASPHRMEFAPALSTEQAVNHLRSVLQRARYRVHESRLGPVARLYATKGNVTRMGPVVAHSGILLLLLASVYGAFYGFKAQELAAPGETFNLARTDAFMPNMNPGIWQGRIPNWNVTVNDFRIEYYPEGKSPDGMTVVQQYYADLSIRNARGELLKRQTISVNHPVQVGDITIYQASFQPTGKLFMAVNGQPATWEVNTNFGDRPVSLAALPDGRAALAIPFFAQQDPGARRNYVVLLMQDRHGIVGAEPGKMPPRLKLYEGETGTLFGTTFRYDKPEIATGLQIKQAPEVGWIYLAFLVICTGTVMSIFSQRQLWITVRPEADGRQQVLVLYKTKKARLSFMKELKRIQGQLKALWNDPPNQPETRHG